MLKWAIGALFLLSFYANADEVSVQSAAPIKPNPQYTTGDFCNPMSPDFQGYRYKDKVPVCVRNVAWELKSHIYDNYGVPQHCRKHYTIDHYIPLALGGSNLPQNLWPEHKDVKATRQNLEQDLYVGLKNGTVSEQDALTQITTAKQNPPPVVPKDCN